MSYLTIGAFAEATGLSIAALRHYDEIGLLKPARVDTSTGYRRYGEDQFDDARLVCGLRAVGMPIDEVRGVLGRPAEEISAALTAHRERLVVQLRAITQQVRAVDEFAGKGDAMPALDEVRPVQLRIPAGDVGKAAAFYTSAFDAVFVEPISSVQFGAYRSKNFFLLTLGG